MSALCRVVMLVIILLIILLITSCEIVYIEGDNNHIHQGEDVETDLDVEVPKEALLDAEIPK